MQLIISKWRGVVRSYQFLFCGVYSLICYHSSLSINSWFRQRYSAEFGPCLIWLCTLPYWLSYELRWCYPTLGRCQVSCFESNSGCKLAFVWSSSRKEMWLKSLVTIRYRICASSLFVVQTVLYSQVYSDSYSLVNTSICYQISLSSLWPDFANDWVWPWFRWHCSDKWAYCWKQSACFHLCLQIHIRKVDGHVILKSWSCLY